MKARRWRGIMTWCRSRSITASMFSDSSIVSEIGGPAYADSVNVGMTDLVAALRWVHDNIANFGGDPDRVMIYGQSGGGSKVTTLMGMPSAAGLFHRASVQSGGGGNPPSAEQSRELARQVMKELGLAPNDIAALQKMDWAKLNAAANAAAAKINPPAPRSLGMGAPPGPRRASAWDRPWMAASSPCAPSTKPRRRFRRMCRC